jgi:hypothetical protein
MVGGWRIRANLPAACLSNSLCYDPNFNHVIRGVSITCTLNRFPRTWSWGCQRWRNLILSTNHTGSCTNRSWSDDTLCPHRCMNLTRHGDIRQCANSNNLWTCGFDTTRCDDPFTLPQGFVKDKREFEDNAIIQAGNCTGQSSDASGYPAAPSTLSTTTSCPSAEKCVGPSSIALGGGVGIGVGLPLFIALGVIGWLLYKTRNELAEAKRVVAPAAAPTMTTTVTRHHDFR